MDQREDVADLRNRLVSAVRRTCPPWLADQTDDLVQMALVKILRRHGEGDELGQEALSATYLYRVAHSVVVDEIRRRRRRNEIGMTPSLPDRLGDPAALGPERQAGSQQIARAVVECLKALKESRRRAVTLHLQGHGVPEVAELLDIDRKKAENLVYRGLADLRSALKERGITP